MTLAEIADELYGLLPAQFTKARDAAVKQARADGERELAEELRELRRPPVAAWAVNLLARGAADELAELFELGAQLRAAQEALAGADLRALSGQRHRVIATLTEQARALVVAEGQQLADAAAREVSATLEAGLSDEAAAAAIRSGRLMQPLASTGLEPVELRGAVAAPDDLPAAPARGPAAAALKPAPAKNTDRGARRDAAQAAAREAKAALSTAERELAKAERAATAAEDAHAEANAHVDELAAALAQAKADQSAADSERRRAARVRDTAQRDRDAAEHAHERADAVFHRLR